jgi:hypothetical protein
LEGVLEGETEKRGRATGLRSEEFSHLKDEVEKTLADHVKED